MAKETVKVKRRSKNRPRRCTRMQRRFVQLLVEDPKRSQREAYELAGYKCRGQVAENEASKTIRKPLVQAYYQSLLAKAEKKAVVDRAWVMQQLIHLKEKAVAEGNLGTALGCIRALGEMIEGGVFNAKGGPEPITAINVQINITPPEGYVGGEESPHRYSLTDGPPA